MLGLMLKTPMGLFRGFLGVYRLVKKRPILSNRSPKKNYKN